MGTIAVLFSYIYVAEYTAAEPRRSRGGSRRTGERDCRGLRTILSGVSGLVKKPLDCAVRAFIIPIYCLLSSARTRLPVKLTVLQANLRP